MNHKKIANRNWEEGGTLTTRTTSRHGLSKKQRLMKRYFRRLGKRVESEVAFKDQES